jgi:hypothetical protein
VLLTAGLIGRPPRIGRPAWLFLAGLSGLAAWSLASGLWADSLEQATVGADRLAVYAALAGVLLILVRTDSAATLMMAATGALVLAEGLVTVLRMWGDDPAALFIGGRLDAPLGYINGQAAYHLVGFWCLVAVAEQRRSVVAAGAGLAGATLLASLLLLSQSRGIVLATAVSAGIVLALVPGRTRRAWALLVVAGAVGAGGPQLLEVYRASRTAELPSDVVQGAATVILLATLAAGLIWGGAVAAAAKLGGEGLLQHRGAADRRERFEHPAALAHKGLDPCCQRAFRGDRLDHPGDDLDLPAGGGRIEGLEVGEMLEHRPQ